MTRTPLTLVLAALLTAGCPAPDSPETDPAEAIETEPSGRQEAAAPKARPEADGLRLEDPLREDRLFPGRPVVNPGPLRSPEKPAEPPPAEPEEEAAPPQESPIGSECDEDGESERKDFDGDGLADTCDPDDDGDGVEDEADLCPWTEASDVEAGLAGKLAPGRLGVIEAGDPAFSRGSHPAEEGEERQVPTLEDTAGCNCVQILDAVPMDDLRYTDQLEYGCEEQLVRGWVDGAWD